MNCKDCKHWENQKDDFNGAFALGRNFGKCKKVKMLWSSTEWQETKELDEYGQEVDRLVLLDEYKNCKAFAQDASDYHAYLITTSDFGCVQFERKEDKVRV